MSNFPDDELFRTRRHRELEAEARLREKEARRRRRLGITPAYWSRSRHHVINSPVALDFDGNYESTVRFLDAIRRNSVDAAKVLFVVMTRCASLAPEVALVLGAEIERCLHHHPKTINGNNPRSEAVTAAMRDIGFFEHLNFNVPPHTHDQPNGKTYLRMKSGVQGGGQHADDLRRLVLGDVVETTPEVARELIRGLVEAMLNVQMHAYPDDIEPAFKPMPHHRWWIAGYRSPSTAEIGFMAYDQGVGIPATLPRKQASRVADLLGSIAAAARGEAPTVDHLLIQRAATPGISRLDLAGHGNGLNDFKRLVTVGKGQGSLRILSGRGSYLYAHDGTETAEPLPASFHGTLIVWRLLGSDAVLWEKQDASG